MKQIRKFNPVIGVGLVIVITTSLLLYGVKILNDRDAADAWISHTNLVISRIDQVLLGLVNMETGFRGYLLTGQDNFLDPYRTGKSQYESAIQQLLDLTDDNSSQEARWKEVQTLVRQWQDDWVAKGIQFRQQVNAGKADQDVVLNYVLSEGGKEKTDAIRAILAAGRDEEVGLLKERTGAGQKANRLAYEVMLGGMILAVIFGLGVGILLARSYARSSEYITLQHYLLEERDKERMKISRDLHDGPVQDLVATTFTLQTMLGAAADEQEVGQINLVKSTLQKVIADLRAYAMELRSPVLSQFGLEKAIQSYLEAFQKKHPEIEVHFIARQKGELLPQDFRDPLFRIFQESMNNIVRHAQATEVEIVFEKQSREVVLEIRDNGVGFEPVSDWLALASQGHLGLVGIRERADSIGGRAEIISHPGKGTCLRVVSPACGARTG